MIVRLIFSQNPHQRPDPLQEHCRDNRLQQQSARELVYITRRREDEESGAVGGVRSHRACNALIREGHWPRSAKVGGLQFDDVETCGTNEIVDLPVQVTPSIDAHTGVSRCYQV